ncbi:MAG: hypothetical protein KF779_04180 [Hyphomonadaceae bacterium]|nr:hypothetical protein [Hyphomonadaceae bacterium]
MLRGTHLTAALVLLAACASSRMEVASSDRPVNICAVLADPSPFDGEVVRVVGRLRADIHGASVEDETCPDVWLPIGSYDDAIGALDYYSVVRSQAGNWHVRMDVELLGRIEQRIGEVPSLVVLPTEFYRVRVTDGGQVTDHVMHGD